MHQRYFSPVLKRFISVDPVRGKIANSQSWNRYSYVLNNPMRFTDPSGETIAIDDQDGLALIQHALDDEELASQLTMETVTEEHSFLGLFSWTTSKTIISNGDADWSNSANPNARLIDAAAIDTSTEISFSVTDEDLSYASGAVTNSLEFSEGNKISIRFNPAQVGAARVPGPNGQKIRVPIGVAVIHEFGHAWGNFNEGVYGGPGARAVGANTDKHSLNWENLARQRFFALRNRPFVPRTGH